MIKCYDKTLSGNGYLTNFEVGDWSEDGHGKCDDFLVFSKRPVQSIREAHFKCKDMYGIKIGKICNKDNKFRLC